MWFCMNDLASISTKAVYLRCWHCWCCMKLPPSWRVLYTPYNHAPCHFTARSHKGLQTQEPRTRPTQHYRHQQFQTFPTISTLLKTRLTVCIMFLLCQVMTRWHAELGHRKFYLVKLDCPAWHKRKRPSTSLLDHAACYDNTSQTQHQPTWPCCMLLQHKPKLHPNLAQLWD